MKFSTPPNSSISNQAHLSNLSKPSNPPTNRPTLHTCCLRFCESIAWRFETNICHWRTRMSTRCQTSVSLAALWEYLTFLTYCWWFRIPANQLIDSLSHYLQCFIHPGWYSISSIQVLINAIQWNETFKDTWSSWQMMEMIGFCFSRGGPEIVLRFVRSLEKRASKSPSQEMKRWTFNTYHRLSSLVDAPFWFLGLFTMVVEQH